jgi:hypothetical protein
MLGETGRPINRPRPAGAALMAPRGASAAPPSRSDQDAAPPRARGSSVDGGIVQGADQAQPSSTMGTRQDILRDGKHHVDLARPQTSESRRGHHIRWNHRSPVKR